MDINNSVFLSLYLPSFNSSGALDRILSINDSKF